MSTRKIMVIGGAVADVSLCPVDSTVFERSSTSLDTIPLQPGGDAMNEASVLARLGNDVSLCTLLGKDAVGTLLLHTLEARHIGVEHVIQRDDISSSINVVLVSADGERRFVTSSQSALRRLSLEHILPMVSSLSSSCLVSFASLFVSPALDIADMTTLFKTLKDKGCHLCADMTRAKKGEKVRDLMELLPYIDELFANYDEGALLTDADTPEEIVDAFLSHGARQVILKLGSKGCLYASQAHRLAMPAYSHAHVIDTTGAGDTFAACYIHALMQNMPLKERIAFATAGASVCIEHIGHAPKALNFTMLQKRTIEILSSCPSE